MGAEIPQLQTNRPEAKPKTAAPLLIAGVLFLIICALKWQDVVEYINGEARLTEKHQHQLKKKLNEIDEAEQYALIATKDGWFPCLHSGFPLYHLRVGEVWKYGVTTKGERGRYSSRFLLDNSVAYIIEFAGTVSECYQAEQIQLFSYPVLPENLARLEKDRLLRPPYNPVFK